MKRAVICLLLLSAGIMFGGCGIVPEPEQSTESLNLYSGRDKRQLYQAIYNAAKDFQTSVTVSGDPDQTVLSEVCNQIGSDYPELFWFGGWSASNFNGSVTEITLHVPMQSEQHRYRYMYQQLMDTTETIRKEIPADASDYEKALYVHDYLTAHTAYNAEAEQGSNAYGCLVSHAAFCEGYSRAFLLLMNQLGVPAGNVSGTADGYGHMWNYIQLSGEYYWVDVTWDDTRIEGADTEQCNHYYCFINDDLMLQTHTIGSGQLFIPACTSMEMNYFVQNGFYLESGDFDAVRPVIEKQLQAQKAPIELMFDSKASYDAALHALFDENGLWTLENLPPDVTGCAYSSCETPAVLRIDLTSDGDAGSAEISQTEAAVGETS